MDSEDQIATAKARSTFNGTFKHLLYEAGILEAQANERLSFVVTASLNGVVWNTGCPQGHDVPLFIAEQGELSGDVVIYTVPLEAGGAFHEVCLNRSSASMLIRTSGPSAFLSRAANALSDMALKQGFAVCTNSECNGLTYWDAQDVEHTCHKCSAPLEDPDYDDEDVDDEEDETSSTEVNTVESSTSPTIATPASPAVTSALSSAASTVY